jgi:hypothetical protein
VDDTLNPDTDSVFKQLDFFHENGDVALYPCLQRTAVQERREEILDMLEKI